MKGIQPVKEGATVKLARPTNIAKPMEEGTAVKPAKLVEEGMVVQPPNTAKLVENRTVVQPTKIAKLVEPATPSVKVRVARIVGMLAENILKYSENNINMSTRTRQHIVSLLT